MADDTDIQESLVPGMRKWLGRAPKNCPSDRHGIFMSVFNRVVVVIIAVAILVLAVTTLLVAVGVVAPDVLPFGWFRSQLGIVVDATGGGLAAIIAITVVVALGMIGLLYAELVPSGKPASLLISSAENGVITIDAGSVCVLAEHTAATARSVHRVRCRLKHGAGGLLISCQVSLALGSNIPETGAELRSRIKEVVEELTGLSVAQVDIRTKYEPAKAKRLAVR
jgi:hypothetical protein